MRPIYLDHATTTPLDPRVREAMLPFLGEKFGSASSLHRRGMEARDGIGRARGAVARLLGAEPEEILFTASATEANNLALKGTALASRPGGRILVAATEHISVLHPVRSLEREGFDVAIVPVDAAGLVDRAWLESELARGALLLTVAQGSAEIGTLQPVAELSELARSHGVP
ncbi:MAG TPA: aminotransferase class V-fold PLP-dependent enzyme, partial [Candidatus Methylomirabilis sp.]|nr:aminotransferase class V-fold PLP-dependent enzyme [Candidatus Methylomirabilis sp.]